jgi:hypothetical protein
LEEIMPNKPLWMQPSWIVGVILLGALWGFIAWSKTQGI